jgi:acyl-CoA synthetase (AMP-forming)/AMP-acid ligase II
MYDAFVAFHARMRPRAVAVITPQRRVTYAEFDADVNRYAAALTALGVGPDRGVVGLDIAQSYRHAVMLIALARLGVTASAARDSRADLRISDRAGEASETLIRLSRPWIAGVEAAPPTEVASAPRDPDTLARVLLTSGTTRTPRRVGLTWRYLEADSLNGVATFGAGRLGVWVAQTGLETGMGFTMAVLAWSVGAAVAVNFAARGLPPLLERHRTGVIGLTPAQLREMLAALPAGFELKPEWRFMVTGAALPSSLAREARLRLSPDVQVYYGSTEGGRMAIGPGLQAESTAGATGGPVPGVSMKIVDEAGQELGDGESGEIRVFSPRTQLGYLDPEDRAGGPFVDGWFQSGDMGRRLADGSYVIEGRVDERINVDGVKVLPNALEDALLEHPQVKDAAAFAMPDAQGAEDCWVAVVAEGEVTREALMAHLQRAGPPLPPIRFAWTEAIARNDMGKIDRAALRAQTSAALEKPKG